MVLALRGGRPAYDLRWPIWPQSTPAIEQAALRVLRSGRWAISGMSSGLVSEERAFGQEFADYIGVEHGVPVTNGSAGLVVALEALGVKHGDEVLVPGLVWVACASAVARIGGVPVLVDVERDTFCMSPAAAEAALTDRTRAILLPHLYSSIADLDSFAGMAERHGLWLLEDCSQAHGAAWRGRRVGSFGAAGVFSFQNGKMLTAGEGGIVVTADPHVHDAVQQLRSDGRRWTERAVRRGFPDLDEIGARQGHNHCMTELQAAVLREGLLMLDEQNRRRADSLLLLDELVAPVEGAEVVRRRDPRVTVPNAYHVPIRLDRSSFGDAAIERIGEAVALEIGLYLEPVDPPLSQHPLYQPSRYERFSPERRQLLMPERYDLPAASELASSCLTVPHHALLAEPELLECLVDAIVHVQRHAEEL